MGWARICPLSPLGVSVFLPEPEVPRTRPGALGWAILYKALDKVSEGARPGVPRDAHPHCPRKLL